MQTPTQAQAMEATTDMKNVKVDVATVDVSGGLPTMSKLAHVLAVVVAGVIAVCVSAVLADGTSVITLKDASELPRITNYSLKEYGIDYRADELLGPTYGIGLHHDQSGSSWTQIGAGSTVKELVKNLRIPIIAAALPSVISTDGLKHPVPLLSCNDLQTAGIAAMSLGYIAEVVAVVMVIFHALVLAGLVPSKVAKPLGGLIWFVLTAGFLVVVTLACGIYTATWKCDNIVIPSIKLSDHFEYNYGFYFAVIGYISALLVTSVLLAATTTTDGEKSAPHRVQTGVVPKILGGVVVGVVAVIICAFAVLGSNDAFAAPAPKDPNYNPCAGQKPKHAGPGDKYFSNTACFKDSVTQTLEQAGANVTKGFKGLMDAGDRVPITSEYSEAGLCPVNVHWHLGAEHLSVGEFDTNGKGPINPYGKLQDDGYAEANNRRQLAGSQVRQGYRCHKYDSTKEMFTKKYDWKHCEKMVVGETYEIHWPHSAAGQCGNKWQMQSPFYDGVFCKDGIIKIAPLNTYEKIGVQSQVFTIVNDDVTPEYQYDDLIKGAWNTQTHWTDIAKYTGSTTGTTRDNYICSRYTPVTWQVDRKCHLISARSFDKLCEDMKAQADDMSSDLHAHGSRIASDPRLVANNQQSRA